MNYAQHGLQIAKEALKPASNIVDALLAPKIRRVREWSASQDLESRIDGDKLEGLFLVYMQRLLRRASGVSTLVFPQQILALPLIYEPLQLEARPLTANLTARSKSARKPSKKEEAAKIVGEASITRQGARTYIVDNAGMGKSTFVRYLILSEIVERDRVPLLLDLRRVVEHGSLLEALARDLDELHKVFDRDVFLRLLSVGRFLLVLDGLDEVASADRAKLSAEIEELSTKADKSAIVLTSRPEVPLPLMTGAKLLMLAPLDATQAKALVLRYDKVGDIDVGQRLIEKLAVFPKEFLRTPLLVALIYRSFGYNGEVSAKASSFYDELYSALYKGHDLTKAGFARPKESRLDFDSFRRLLRGFAFLTVAQQRTTLQSEAAAISLLDEARELTSAQPHSLPAYLDDLLLAVPLLVRDGPEIRFAHKTIAEFFAAEYLAFSLVGADMAKAMCHADHGDRFIETFAFLRELNPALFRRVVAQPIALAFQKHAPAVKGSALRTLTFVANESEMGVFSPRNAWGGREPEPESAREFRVQAHIEDGQQYLVQFVIKGPWQPLVSTVFAEFSSTTQRALGALNFNVFQKLPKERWIRLTDPVFQDAELAEALDDICRDLGRMYFQDVRKVAAGQSPGLIFDDRKVSEVLEAIASEERARTNLRAMLDGQK